MKKCGRLRLLGKIMDNRLQQIITVMQSQGMPRQVEQMWFVLLLRPYCYIKLSMDSHVFM